MNDRHPRLRIPRVRRDRAGASRRAVSARRAVALASSGLALISLAGVLGACAAPEPAARDRGVLISATPIARLPESAVAAELRNARDKPGTPALGAGMVRYGARTLAARHGYQLDPGVLATGFSEGGAAAMALGRALQQGQSPFFRLTALAPISSPLDLAGAELPGIFNGQVAAVAAKYYIGYVLTSWNPLYHLYSSPSQVFRQPYAARVPGLYDGSHQDLQVIAALPPLSRLLTPAYLRLLRHPTGKFLRALNANSTCPGWTPRVPVRLYAASGDSQGPPVNSVDCLRAIRAGGGDASLIRLGSVGRFGLEGHFVSAFLALPKIVRWFAGGSSR